MNEIVGALDRAFALIEGHPKPNFHRLRSGPPAAVTEVFSEGSGPAKVYYGVISNTEPNVVVLFPPVVP
jgi:hypothetical protein